MILRKKKKKRRAAKNQNLKKVLRESSIVKLDTFLNNEIEISGGSEILERVDINKLNVRKVQNETYFSKNTPVKGKISARLGKY